jgi:hypothetical protein
MQTQSTRSPTAAAAAAAAKYLNNRDRFFRPESAAVGMQVHHEYMQLQRFEIHMQQATLEQWRPKLS